jgi:hypothetical protein
MTSRSSNGEFKLLEYDVLQLGKETMVQRRTHIEESLKRILNNAEKQIEQLIYEFVCDLVSSVTEATNELSYYFENLSKDGKFMRAVDRIYEDKQKVFEIGYRKLRNKS